MSALKSTHCSRFVAEFPLPFSVLCSLSCCRFSFPCFLLWSLHPLIGWSLATQPWVLVSLIQSAVAMFLEGVCLPDYLCVYVSREGGGGKIITSHVSGRAFLITWCGMRGFHVRQGPFSMTSFLREHRAYLQDSQDTHVFATSNRGSRL